MEAGAIEWPRPTDFDFIIRVRAGSGSELLGSNSLPSVSRALKLCLIPRKHRDCSEVAISGLVLTEIRPG